MSNPGGGLYAKTYAELRALSNEELVRQHDEIATGTVPVSYYLDELGRRTVERQGKRMLYLTYLIAAMTVVNVAAVIISLSS